VEPAMLDEKRYSRYFKAFGDPSRLKILTLLADKEMTVSEITRAVGLAQPTVSRHLGILRDAGLVVDRREGQQVHYKLNRDTVSTCCQGLCDCLQITLRFPPKKTGRKRA
jgi:ArsR family transcriptional regulator